MTNLTELADRCEAGLPDDLCVCGDYRRDHPNDGPCTFNSPDFDMCHGGKDCMSFRSAQASNEQINGRVG